MVFANISPNIANVIKGEEADEDIGKPQAIEGK